MSCRGKGNAVLIKSGIPYFVDGVSSEHMLAMMQKMNPSKNGSSPRPFEKLCAGQTLLCKSLGLKVKIWDQKTFHPEKFYITDVGYQPGRIVQTKRLGIPIGRDEHLFYRFIDAQHANCCTRSNPLKKKNQQENIDYFVLT